MVRSFTRDVRGGIRHALNRGHGSSRSDRLLRIAKRPSRSVGSAPDVALQARHLTGARAPLARKS